MSELGLTEEFFRDAPDASEMSGACGAGEMLARLSSQIAAADRRYSAVLEDVLACLERIRRDNGGLVEDSCSLTAASDSDDPFAAISAKIEQAFAPPRAGGSLFALSLRFDDLERKVKSITGDGLSRRMADDAALSISAASSAACSEARFAKIENLLADVADRLSDERLARIFEEARAVARGEFVSREQAAPQEAITPAIDVDMAVDRIDELCAVVDRMVCDHRRASQAAMTMMGTLHDALARVLDRLDQTDAARRRAMMSMELNIESAWAHADWVSAEKACRQGLFSGALRAVSHAAQGVAALLLFGVQKVAAVSRGVQLRFRSRRRQSADDFRRPFYLDGPPAYSSAPMLATIMLFCVLAATHAAEMIARPALDAFAAHPAIAAKFEALKGHRANRPAADLPVPPRNRRASR